MVLFAKALAPYPMAVVLLRLFEFTSANEPTAVLKLPVVLPLRLNLPKAVFSDPEVCCRD